MTDQITEPGAATPQSKLVNASIDLVEAKQAMRDHDGPYSGEAWNTKIDVYRDRWEAFEAVLKEVRGSTA